MYGIQMIFGFKIASKIYMLFNNALLSNFIILTIIILLSVILNYMINLVFKKLKY